MAVKRTKIKRMFICIFITFYVLNVSFASDIMTAIWDEDVYVKKAFLGISVPDEESKLLIKRLSQLFKTTEMAEAIFPGWHEEVISWKSVRLPHFFDKENNYNLFQLPLTDRIKTDAWYKILGYRKVENLDLLDWRKYEPLIPNLPIPMLRQVNFSDEFVLMYFGQQKVQLSLVAEEVTFRNEDILNDEEKIIKLGNIFCGFSSSVISAIKDSTLRSLLERNFFQTIKGCSIEQFRVLIKVMRQYTVIGPPRTWKPETVKKAGSLIAGLKPFEIREIREKSFSQISSDVISLIPVETLRKIKDSQLRTLNRSALLAWRRKTRDLRSLYLERSSSFSVNVSFVVVGFSLLSLFAVEEK